MGLRINTNVNAITALTNLRQSDQALTRSLERLSTGLRINRASDDPAGLVISEQLRAQIGSLKQAVENTEFDQNMLGTGEQALQEVEDLLIKVRESALFANNTGGISDEQIEAEQDAVDSAIAAIDRIAATTRFGRKSLLNGSADFSTSAAAGIVDLKLRSVFMNTSSITFSAVVNTVASQATLSLGAGVVLSNTGGDVSVRVTGLLGSEEVSLFSTMSAGNLSNAINNVRDFTGVYASGGDSFTEEFGEDAFVSLEILQGTAGATPFDEGRDTGADVNVTLAGTTLDADGFDVRFQSSFLKGEISFSNGIAAGTFTFSVTDFSGLVMHVGSEPTAHDQLRVGIQGVDSSRLGQEPFQVPGPTGRRGGFLTTLTAGGENDLKSDPSDAIRIADKALDQINALRGFLGAVADDTLEPNERSLNVAIQNLAATESEIRDLDFAAETADFTRAQVLFNAGTAVLASANVIPQQVLTLLR